MNIVIEDLTKAEVFAGIFQHMRAFADNITLYFETNRLYMQAMNSSRVSIVDLSIPKNWFDTYDNKNDAPFQIGINATMLFKILTARDKTQQINIVFKDNDTDRLYIDFTSNNKSEFDRHFEIPLIDIDAEIMGIPDIEYQAEFSLLSSKFASMVNQLQMFGDSVEVTCTEENIGLSSTSIESGKMLVDIKIEDLSLYMIDEGATVESAFGLKYLHDICLYNKLTKEVSIKITKDFPMRIEYKLPVSGDEDEPTLTFYLAPKIDD